MSSIFEYSLEELTTLETDAGLVFAEFNNDVAWQLGVSARELALKKYPSKAVIIDITLANGHQLFRTTINSGTALDNDHWVERKRNTVLRFGTSSFFVGQKLRIKGVPLEEAAFISSKDYATHGGSIPLKVRGLDSLVGTLTVSGLKQDEDHLLALEAVKEFNA